MNKWLYEVLGSRHQVTSNIWDKGYVSLSNSTLWGLSEDQSNTYAVLCFYKCFIRENVKHILMERK